MINDRDPLRFSTPAEAREKVLSTLAVTALCLAMLLVGIRAGNPWLVGLSVLIGVVSLALIPWNMVRRISPYDARLTWRETKDGLQPVSPGWYCLMREPNVFIFVQSRLVIDIDRRGSGVRVPGRTIRVRVTFSDEVPSPRAVKSFREWYAGLVKVCSPENIQEMHWRLDHPNRVFVGSFGARTTTDPIDTYLRESDQDGFAVELDIHEWEVRLATSY